MNSTWITSLRLQNQQLVSPSFNNVSDLAKWMCAIQAQDYRMAKWAFGIRLPGSTEQAIDRAIDSGELIRTHLLRPTWHFAAAEDIGWLLDISSAHIIAQMKTRDTQLGLDKAIFSKSNKIIEKSLRDNNHMTREELIPILEKSGIDTGENRASHLFMRAEMDGIICSGRQKAGKPSFAILAERIQLRKPRPTRREAIRELCHRYFISRGPATISDFSWWSGLTLKDARQSIEDNRDKLLSENTGDSEYWFADTDNPAKQKTSKILFLPAFDEFLISYRDREASLALVDNRKAVSDNGIFYPVMVSGGQVIGTWKRILNRDHANINVNFFKKNHKFTEKELERPMVVYSEFIGKKVKV